MTIHNDFVVSAIGIISGHEFQLSHWLTVSAVCHLRKQMSASDMRLDPVKGSIASWPLHSLFFRHLSHHLESRT